MTSKVLIAEPDMHLGNLWKRHVERQGHPVRLVASQDEAIAVLHGDRVSLIVLDLGLNKGSALAVADYANYRHPEVPVVFVTASTFFSDGSIFRHAGNACAFLGTDTAPEDLALMVAHYAASR